MGNNRESQRNDKKTIKRFLGHDARDHTGLGAFT
jgi:hypothetical protein